jgi:hypothetical protein
MLNRILIAIAAVIVIVNPAISANSDGTAQNEMERQQREIRKLVASGNYAAISKRADYELAQKTRFADGRWRLSLLYAAYSAALDEQMRDAKGWDRALGRLEHLTKNSPMAWLLYEQTLSARAWAIRGPGFAREVSPEAMSAFRNYLSRAREVLDEHKNQLSSNPSWFSMRITLATELGESEDIAKKFFTEGAHKHPGYHAIYFDRLRHVSPIWGGSKAKMLDLLSEVARMDGQTAQEGLYVRLVWYAQDSGFLLIHEKEINSDAMHNGFDRIAESYPDQWNVQKLFTMACERSDKPYAIRLLTAVKEPPLETLLGRDLRLYQQCKDWAQGRTSGFLIREHVDDQVKEYLVQ